MRSHLPRYDRRRLFGIVTRPFVADALPAASTTQADLIRCILLRNIHSRRVSGKLAQLRVADPKMWLWRYAQTLFVNYTTEHATWRTWQQGSLREQVAVVSETLESILDLHYAESGPNTLGLARTDVLASAFMLTLNRLSEYPFDLPLYDWLTELVHQCVWAWRRGKIYATHARAMQFERCPDGSASGMAIMAAPSFESSPELWGDSIDLQRRLEALSDEDRLILELRLDGKKPAQIADVVQRKPKTISNKLTQIQHQLFSNDDE